MPDRKLYPCIVDNTLPNNRITTAKYNWFTFLPKNLAEQFSKLANVYFLVPYFQQLAFDLLILPIKVLAILQTIPAITISDRKPVILVPLIVILVITAVKDFVEDYRRHKSDREENMKHVEVYLPEEGRLNESHWHELKVGNIVKVKRNQPVPADLILLKSSDRKGLYFCLEGLFT